MFRTYVETQGSEVVRHETTFKATPGRKAGTVLANRRLCGHRRRQPGNLPRQLCNNVLLDAKGVIPAVRIRPKPQAKPSDSLRLLAIWSPHSLQHRPSNRRCIFFTYSATLDIGTAEATIDGLRFLSVLTIEDYGTTPSDPIPQSLDHTGQLSGTTATKL